MKEEGKNNFKLQKIKSVNYISILEIILVLYSLILFKNYIPSEVFSLLNYSINTKVINNLLLYKNITNNDEINFKISVKDENNGLFTKKRTINFEEYILNNNFFCVSSFVKIFDNITKIEIIKKHIMDILFLVIYYIYSKSRKRVNCGSNRYNKLCVN